MVYLIKKVYGLGGGEFYASAVGQETPVSFKTLEDLATGLQQEQRKQELWHAANPENHSKASAIMPLAAAVAPKECAIHSKHPTRMLDGGEKARLRQLIPAFRP